MKPSNDTMRQALRLTQAGDLQAATRAIQDALAGGSGAAPAMNTKDSQAGAAPQGDCIDGEFRVVDGRDAASAVPPADTRAARLRAASLWHTWPRTAANHAGLHPGVAPPARADVPEVSGEGNFHQHRFTCEAGELHYKLFVPAGLDTAGAPLLLMLHGCTQTPDDFARGTRMNQLAVEHGYVVAWPAQSAERNQNRCWNWFRGNDQQRGQGEPAILAALARKLVATHQLDANRVYIAGLSAGGAMAAVLASTHPDIFAAIGVHSGLPTGLASDIPSALMAMRKGSRLGRPSSVTGADPVPAIVFHGDRDATVHPSNGHGVIEQSLGTGKRGDQVGGNSTVERGTVAGGRSFTRTVHRTADGHIAAEHWVIQGATHAWSGGDPAGSYTDPCGPDASAQMLRFFVDCTRSGQ
jgi:poly(hydroxyalkanoate) depolymerase family esterase